MLITKGEEVTKQRFYKIPCRKLRPRGSVLLEFIHSSGWGGGERLFDFDWEEEEVGAYLLFRSLGWALTRINTVSVFFTQIYNNNKNLLRYFQLHTWHYLFS